MKSELRSSPRSPRLPSRLSQPCRFYFIAVARALDGEHDMEVDTMKMPRYSIERVSVLGP